MHFDESRVGFFLGSIFLADAGLEKAEEVVRSEIRTLVVDDSPVALRAMCSVIARQRNLMFVGLAHNGSEALALAQTTHPDLILLDLEMPVMGGIETTSYLTRDCPDARVVIVTVHNTHRVRRLCFDSGASAFIAKDCLNDELPIVVSRLFGDGE